jgi:hypothetical protein
LTRATCVGLGTHREAMLRYDSRVLDERASVLDEMPSMPKVG